MLNHWIVGAAGLVVVALLGAGRLALREAGTHRGPIAIPTPGGPAPERLLLDTVPPRQSVRLLWLAGRPARPSGDSVLVVDGEGSVLSVDARLRIRRPRLSLGGREATSAAAAANGGLWVTDAAGALHRLDPRGRIIASSPVPFPYPEIGGLATSGEVWLVRSPQRFAYHMDSITAPLLVRLSERGTPPVGLGWAIRPSHVLLGDLANAGHLAVGQGALYYAPFIRDEIVALGFQGDTLWLTRRGLPQSTPDPRFEVRREKVVIDYHPVNLGIAVGPDRRIYALSTPGFTMTESRLDVLDPASGQLVRTASLPTARPTLAADNEGRVYLLDEFRLLSGVPPLQREQAPSFDLPTLGGERVNSAALRGRIVLLNFWASWCAPCRAEMPALDSLRKRLPESDFAFLAINEEADTADARAFAAPYGRDFPVALARGRMRERFHYPGLPYTVLLDRAGNIAGRWMGFGGPEQIQTIHALVRAELARDGHEHRQHSHIH